MSDELKSGESGVIAVKEMHKKVVLEFPYLTERVILDPATALGVANAIAESAYTAEHGVHPENSLKASVSEVIEKKLIARLAIVIPQLTRKGRKPEYIAKEAMSIVLAEVM